MPGDWILLFLSVAALALGPLLYRMALARLSLLSALDGFLFVGIGGLVLLDILPAAMGQSGWWAVAFAVAGFLGPSAIEGSYHRVAHQAHRIAVLLGLLSLILHALADGAALVGTFREGAGVHHALPLAVILHRIPVGLTIWWLLRPAFGVRVAGGALLVVAVSTLFGFHFAAVLVGSLSSQALGYFQALVAGSLLHVVVHRTERLHSHGGPPVDKARRRRWAGTGALAGLGLVAALTAQGLAERPEAPAVLDAFFRLALESAPALLLAYFLAGMISAFLPRGSVRWMNRGNSVSQALRGMMVGLPLPICSCGVVPLFQTLTRQGAAAPAALAFMIATPELSLDALLLSLPLLGPDMTLLRLAGAAFVALSAALVVGTWSNRKRIAKPSLNHDAVGCGSLASGPFLARLRAGLRVGLLEVVDGSAPWLLLGLAVAAALEPSMGFDGIAGMPSWLQVPVFALAGMPVYVCASGATPLVAVLLAKGVSPGAALAFLITAPATNVTTFGVVSDALGRRTAVLFAVTVAFLSVGTGMLANWVLPHVEPPLSQGAEAGVGTFQTFCLAALAFLFLFSLLRQGPRDFTGQVFSLDDWGGHSHSHG